MMKNKIDKLTGAVIALIAIMLIGIVMGADTIITDEWVNSTGQLWVGQTTTSGIAVLVNRDLAAAGTDSVLVHLYNINATDDQGVLYVQTDVNATASNPTVKIEATQLDHDQGLLYIVTAADATAGDSVVKIEATAAAHDEEILEIANAGSGASILLSGTTKSISDGTASWSGNNLAGFGTITATTGVIAPYMDTPLIQDAADIVIDSGGGDIDIDAADLWLDSGNAITFDGSTHANYIYLSTNLQIIAGADILLDPVGADVDIDAADLWIDATFHVALDGSSDANYLTYNNSDIVVIAAGDIWLDPAGGDVMVDGSLTTDVSVITPIVDTPVIQDAALIAIKPSGKTTTDYLLFAAPSTDPQIVSNHALGLNMTLSFFGTSGGVLGVTAGHALGIANPTGINRVADGVINVYGDNQTVAAASTVYLQLTHDGSNAQVKTGVGDLQLTPVSTSYNVVIPADCTGSCATGAISWNTTHICICTTTNTWETAAIS